MQGQGLFSREIASTSRPPTAYRARHACNVCRDTSHDAATSDTVRPSPMTASTALYRCSATLTSLIKGASRINRSPNVNHQPNSYNT